MEAKVDPLASPYVNFDKYQGKKANYDSCNNNILLV